MMSKRYNRQEAFFGKEGQDKLSSMSIVVAGIGGLGTHIVQQLAYLGVVKFTLIDDESIDETNLNRYVGALPSDLNEKKVLVAKRIITQINPAATVETIPSNLLSEEAFKRIIDSNCTFGCFDNEGSRLILNELCLAYEIAYFDLATEIFPEGTNSYGGRISITVDSNSCICCTGNLNLDEANEDLENPNARQDREEIYGIKKADLNNTGPSVVSINGAVASIAITEFITWATGLKQPKRSIFYRADQSIVTKSSERVSSDCYYCNDVRSKKDAANVQRYLD